MSLLHNSVKSKSTQRNVHLAHFDLNLENFNLSSHASLNPRQNHHHTHTKLPTLLNTINTSPSHIYLHTRTHKNSIVSSLPHKPYTNTCSLGNPKPNHHLHCTQLIHTRSKQSSRHTTSTQFNQTRLNAMCISLRLSCPDFNFTSNSKTPQPSLSSLSLHHITSK
jgi:hypothetical protein